MINTRCLNNVFGYCGKGIKSGLTVKVEGKGKLTMVMEGTPTTCELNWQECHDHLKFTQVIKPEVLEPPPMPKKKIRKSKATKPTENPAVIAVADVEGKETVKE